MLQNYPSLTFRGVFPSMQRFVERWMGREMDGVSCVPVHLEVGTYLPSCRYPPRGSSLEHVHAAQPHPSAAAPPVFPKQRQQPHQARLDALRLLLPRYAVRSGGKSFLLFGCGGGGLAPGASSQAGGMEIIVQESSHPH